jgi:predicted esterase
VVKAGAGLLASWACAALAAAADSPTTAQVATIAGLLPPDQAAALEKTLPADREVTFRVRPPSGDAATGVLVYISPTDSGELPASWIRVLDEKHLLWIAADDFGNSKLAAERTLVALMAVKLSERLRPPEAQRVWVAGFSGGGRVASRCVTLFARYFDGALFMGGADFVKAPEPAATLMKSRRMVFLTGRHDFNRREMKSVSARYQDAGVTGLLLIDDSALGHQLPPPDLLTRALDFLLQP